MSLVTAVSGRREGRPSARSRISLTTPTERPKRTKGRSEEVQTPDAHKLKALGEGVPAADAGDALP